MGGGASKGKSTPVQTSESLQNNRVPSSAPVPKSPSSPSSPPSSSLHGPKNGELAPLPVTTNSPYRNVPSWYSGNSVPLGPITNKAPPAATSPASSPLPSTSPPPPPAPTATSPPLPKSEVADLKTAHNIKVSDGVNAPLARFKGDVKGGESDDDQVVMGGESDMDGEGEGEGEEEEEERKMQAVPSKSKADQFYQKVFADKMKNASPPPPPRATFPRSASPDPPRGPLHPSQASPSPPPPRPPLSSSPLSDDESSGLYTEYEDFKTTGLLDVRKAAVAVPTLKLAELGEKRSKPPAAAAAVKPPPEVLPVVKHGNFDNDKFRAANAKKKNITDSIFQQTTYDYTKASKLLDSPGASISSASESHEEITGRSSPDSPSSYEYSSDTSADSPGQVMRLPNTPTYKQTFDEFEEDLINSLLEDPKIESPA